MRREFSVTAEGRHIFGLRPKMCQKPKTALEKSLAPRVYFNLMKKKVFPKNVSEQATSVMLKLKYSRSMAAVGLESYWSAPK